MSKGCFQPVFAGRETQETEAESLLSTRTGPVYTGLPTNKSDAFLTFPYHPLYAFPIIQSNGLYETRVKLSNCTDAEQTNPIEVIKELHRTSPFRRGPGPVIVSAQELNPPPNTSMTDSSLWGDGNGRTGSVLECSSIDITPIPQIRDLTGSSGSTTHDEFRVNRKLWKNYRRAWREYSQLGDDSSDLSSINPDPSQSHLVELLPEDSRLDSKDLFKSMDALITAGVIIKEESGEDDQDDTDLDVSVEPAPLAPLQLQINIGMPCTLGNASKTQSGIGGENALRIESPNMRSPLYRKVVICENRRRGGFPDSRILTVLQAFACTGYHSCVSLEYSNTLQRSKATIDYGKEKRCILVRLLTPQVLRFSLSNPVAWLSCGFEHAAMVTVEREVFTWGYGGAGTLGHGDLRSYSAPQRVTRLSGQDIVFIDCGGYHSAAVSDSGRLWTWGRGDVHQLGIPTDRLSTDEFGCFASVPMEVDEFKQRRITIKGVACGEAHTIVLNSEGKVFTFGWAEDGQLGLPMNQLYEGTSTTQVQEVPGLPRVVKVAAGGLFSAALTSMGTVFIWGNGEQGQLGLGSKVLHLDKPTCIFSLSQEKVLDILCGENYCICVTARHKAFGWGLGLAGAFEARQFSPGSALVCYVPIELDEVEIAHHFCIQKRQNASYGSGKDFMISLEEELRRLEFDDQ